MVTKAIDISAWQPWFDAQKAKAAGIETVICRAAYGYAKDKRFDTFAKEAGSLNLGAYQFATWHYNSVNGGSYTKAVQAANAQTSALIAILRTANITSYVALDMEMERGQASFLSKQQMTDICNMVMDKLVTAGYTPLLYASASWFTGRMIPDKIKYKWWVAYYYDYPNAHNFDTVSADFPGGYWGKWMRQNKDRVAIWQFGSVGYAGMYGVGGTNLDKDWCYVPMNTKAPETPAVSPISGDTIKLAIGPASYGDRKTMAALAESLQLPYEETESGLMIIGPASAGDQTTVLTKAAELGLPYAEYKEVNEPDTLPEILPEPDETDELNRIIAELENEADKLTKELADVKEDCKYQQQRADEATKTAAEYLHRLQSIAKIAEV